MQKLQTIEKKINSELTTKIKSSHIRHNELKLIIDEQSLIDVIIFIKNNPEIKFRQLIDITAVDYPDKEKRFKLIYFFLSHEFNIRLNLEYYINVYNIILTFRILDFKN